MKKTLLLLFTLLASANLYPQDKTILTNSTIVKMVKAKLSDELIIDEIKSSATRFNTSPDSILYLLNNKVSDAVISEMKSVTRYVQTMPDTGEKIQTIITPPAVEKTPEKAPEKTNPPATAENKKTVPVKIPPAPAGEISVSSDALGYAIPLQALMKFYEGEFSTLEDIIKSWDAKIRISVDEGNKIKEKISSLEKELTGKINTDSKGFSEEINSLKSKLNETKESYGVYQNSMVSDGLKMIKEIEDFGNRLNNSISDNYSQAGQDVKKRDPDPSSVGSATTITVATRQISDADIDYIAPLSMVLFFYQNEIVSLDKTIDQWNEKIKAITLKDKGLITKIDPLKKEQALLQADQKKNKKQIAELRNRISDLEKERKALAQQMSDDSGDLSKDLALSCKTVQGSLKERIAVIIEEIKYLYQDSFTYKSL